jgi:hypothetical protein
MGTDHSHPLLPVAFSYGTHAKRPALVTDCWLLVEQPGKAASYKPLVAKEQLKKASSHEL